MKYSIKTKDCRLTVTVKLTSSETIDEKALDAFSRLYPRGFLKPSMTKKNQIEYTGPAGESLSNRLKKPITKRDFLMIMEQIVAAAQKIQRNGLMISKLIMDLKYIFFNENTKEVQFLYIPTQNQTISVGIIALMEQVMVSTKPAPEPDMGYVARFSQFRQSQKGFDLNAIEAFIAREDSTVVMSIRQQGGGQSGFMTSKQQHYVDHYDQSRTAVRDQSDATGLLEENVPGFCGDATGLLDSNDGWGAATQLLVQDEGTMLLVQEPPAPKITATLLRTATNETVQVEGPVFRVGKAGGPANYGINNNYVSRSHLDIITRDDHFYAVDLNSMNHTYLNDQILPAQCETEIHDGDRLKLGNEELIFNIEGAAPLPRVCPSCGGELLADASFCRFCGYRV